MALARMLAPPSPGYLPQGCAYSGTGAAWERKAKEAIGLLPDRHGFSPSVVLGPKPPDTIMAEAKPVSQEERQVTLTSIRLDSVSFENSKGEGE